jgi:uncharacterized protein (DUF1697 family)
MARYVALLRGINVGGKNLIKMPALKECFEAHGFEDVSTYIQSGNVIFSAAKSGAGEQAGRIEEMLASTFDVPIRVVLRSRAQMRTVVNRAPDGFGSDPARYRYDVIFLRPPLSATRAMKDVSTKPGVDQVSPGTGVLYFSRLISKATQSHLNRMVGLRMYQDMTIRNWNTTTKLLDLLEG